jgi:thioredoxin-related protein
MKLFSVLVFSFLFFAFTVPAPHWQNNFELAKQTAAAQHKYILLNFSGSDWCGPCIKMHKEIFASEAFSKFADEKLVMVNADFPRQKKNQLTAEQQKHNDALADRYNSNGSFPFTLLLTADGKVIKTWDGFPKENAEEFTSEIRSIVPGNN